MLRIAVVIPLYNHQEYITAALDSVRNQTRRVDKIIVVDDGSTDRSLEIVRNYKDDRIEILTQANSGAHVALNRGIEHAADHDFVAILNSDDIYHPERLERCIGFLEKNPDIDVVATRLKMINHEGGELDQSDPKMRWVQGVWALKKPKMEIIQWLGVANFAKTSSNFIGRGSYLKQHPFRSYRYVHDYFFAVICALDRKLGVLPEELLYYRTHSRNTIKSGPSGDVVKETLQMNFDILKEIAPRLKQSARIRGDYTRYFRSLAENQTDFRTELFFYLIGLLIDGSSPDFYSAAVRAMEAGGFPELTQPSSRALKEHLAENEYTQLVRCVLSSRWLAVGKFLGLTRDLVREEGDTAEMRLALLKKRLRHSRWLRVGRKFGFGPSVIS